MSEIYYKINLNQDVLLNDTLNYYKESINLCPELKEDPLFSHHLNLLVDIICKVGGSTKVTTVGTLTNEYIEPLYEEDMILYANYFLDDAVQWSWEKS